MGLNPNARPSDKNGVVTITFAIVGHEHLQLLSITLLKKDINTCRMLVNFKPLQKVILESAVLAVEGRDVLYAPSSSKRSSATAPNFVLGRRRESVISQTRISQRSRETP